MDVFQISQKWWGMVKNDIGTIFRAIYGGFNGIGPVSRLRTDFEKIDQKCIFKPPLVQKSPFWGQKWTFFKYLGNDGGWSKTRLEPYLGPDMAVLMA